MPLSPKLQGQAQRAGPLCHCVCLLPISQELRAQIVPSAKAYKLERLLAAVKAYQEATGASRGLSLALACCLPSLEPLEARLELRGVKTCAALVAAAEACGEVPGVRCRACAAWVPGAPASHAAARGAGSCRCRGMRCPGCGALVVGACRRLSAGAAAPPLPLGRGQPS